MGINEIAIIIIVYLNLPACNEQEEKKPEVDAVSKKRKASNKQQYPPTKPGDITTGITLWKKICSAGISVGDGDGTKDIAGLSKGEQASLTADARRKAAGIPLPPNFDEAVAMLGQAPIGGLASAVYKQGNAVDGSVQVRKLVQTLSSEIAATKKAVLKVHSPLFVIYHKAFFHQQIFSRLVMKYSLPI